MNILLSVLSVSSPPAFAIDVPATPPAKLPASSASPATVDCSDAILASPVSQDLLNGNVGVHLDALRAKEKDTSPGQSIEALRRATEELIAENKITRDQAEYVMGTRTLGMFAPIIRKYVVAELKSRGFDDANVVQFILNFENVFEAETRIEFAASVARRMLLTVGDAGRSQKQEDLARYLAFVDAFGVDREVFKAFRETWKYVREAHAPTVISFILAVIKQTAHRFHDEVDEAMKVPALPSPEPEEGWSRKLNRWFNPFDEYQPPAALPRSLQQTALELFNGFDVPKFIEDIDVLNPDRPGPPPLLDRFLSLGGSGRLAPLVERLEMTPPFAWSVLVRAQLDHFDRGDVRRIIELPLFRRLSPELRGELQARHELFEAIHVTALDLREHRARVDEEHGNVNSGAIYRFKTEFEKQLPKRLLNTEEWQQGLQASFSRTHRLWWRMNSADFLEIAHYITQQTFIDGNGFRALAILKMLRELSQKFVIDPAKLERFFDSIRDFDMKAGTFIEIQRLADIEKFKEQLDPNRWGYRRPPSEPDPAALVRADLAKLRQLLPTTELTWRRDPDLEKIFVDYVDSLQESSFLNTKAVEQTMRIRTGIKVDG